MIAKFPFTDLTVSDLCILDPRHRVHVTATSLTRLLKRFNSHSDSTCDVDAVLMEFREYKSLPDSQLTPCISLEEFWKSMGELPLPGGEATAIRFGNLATFCKTLLVLPHSTADPECLFSMIGTVLRAVKTETL